MSFSHAAIRKAGQVGPLRYLISNNMHSTWRLLITPPLPGSTNMAIDQALLDLYPATQQPTLRLYQWSPACLSLGLAQRLERDVDRAACAARGIDIVRRPTGGRAILHDQELTYALVVGSDSPTVVSGSILHSYRTISQAVCFGLQRLGLQPELAPRPERHAAKSAACFDLAGDYEITIDGRKLVGSAQARQQGVVLQHGSLLFHADVAALAAVLRLPPALKAAVLAQRLIALDEVLGVAPTFEAVSEAMIAGFAESWQLDFVQGNLTPAEQERVAELVRTKFGNATWTERR